MIPAFSVTLIVACATSPEGLLPTPAGNGPEVRFDWDAEPLPDVPFPSDLATRTDPTSVTGLRLNIPTHAATLYQEEARLKINRLTGFGIYAPMTVGFEAPLDLDNIADRHTYDDKLGRAQFEDDAFFVIDITPGSRTYLQPVELDVGHGRYPLDAFQTDRYFPNDTRSAHPSLVFDTVDEDLNGNGLLDWGEDTDNDGHLDSPNVYPLGGDAFEDLLEWYERESDTLMFRPVMPLREETRYAVLLTSRLIGEDGEPVRSPFDYVHHMRQTEALRPVLDALPGLGLTEDEIAFTWSFTTARVTGDLVDIYQGLHGEGPFATLETEYPAGIGEALQVHEIDSLPDNYNLPIDIIMQELESLGLFEGENADVLVENYGAFSSNVVGGSFVVPYFLVDRDDGGRDDSDEIFELDPLTGEYVAAPQRVPFTCILPTENELTQQPYPLAWFGHGYGSSRFDVFGFGWAFNRLGIAACSFDFPGHGPTIDDDDLDSIETYLQASGLTPFLTHLRDARFRDLDNDGVPDSGGDQWSADAFHTRDMVRQAAVDWMQSVRSLQACGEGEMALQLGGTAMSCDWDDNGVPDIGAESDIFIVGGSLGGINAGVAAAVIPDVSEWAPVVPGAGLLDVALRTKIGGAVEAMHGRLMSPLILGLPTESGGLEVGQLVNSVFDMIWLPIATLDAVPADGRVLVENLYNGESREGYIPADGSFRVGIPADALDPAEKREATGMPEGGPDALSVYEVPDNAGLGDELRITLFDSSGAEVAVIDRFEQDLLFEGVTYRAGSPLVAGSSGTGEIRATPEIRRVAVTFASILEPGDPVAYAPHYLDEPFEVLGGEPVNVLLMPTPGDEIVPINGGIALARAAGFIDREHVDQRYGMTVDQFLIDRQVVRGSEERGPWTDINGDPCLFDADDLDDGTDGTGAPSDAPLRITVDTPVGQSGLRLPYIRTTGTHGFELPTPSRDFDINTFSIMQAATYFHERGARIVDDPCLEDASCSWIPEVGQ